MSNVEMTEQEIELLCAACSFGGLSLLMQNAAFWQESGVRIGQLFLLRLLHGLLAGGLGWIVFHFSGIIGQ